MAGPWAEVISFSVVFANWSWVLDIVAEGCGRYTAGSILCV